MGFFFLDTGGTAQAFFAEKNRDAVADLYLWDSDEDREKFKECHRAVAITLRLMSCTETIDVEMMERHNTYTKGWCNEFDTGSRAPHVELLNILHEIWRRVKVSTVHFENLKQLKPLLFDLFYAKYSKT